MDIDVTFFLQLGLITFLIVVLRPLLVLPLLQVMEDRHQQTQGARAEVKRMERLTALDRQAYHSRLAKARHEVHKRREQQRASGRERAKRIEDAARAEAQGSIMAHRKQLSEAQKQALTTLRPNTTRYAQTLVTRLLGREVAL